LNLIACCQYTSHHWGDVVLSACFLTNRMSSSLTSKVAYSIIFPNDPLFHISPWVFGCVCFVHDLSLELDKLSTRAVKFVFLDHFRLQKEYHCSSSRTKKYYMSANVTFFELILYYSSSIQDVYSIQQVLPIPLVESIVPCASDSPNSVQNPIEPSSPSLITYQSMIQMTSPMLLGKSSFFKFFSIIT